MPQTTNLRLLLSSANHRYRHPLSATSSFLLPQILSFSGSFPFSLNTHFRNRKPPPLFATFSSYSKKHYTSKTDNKNWRPFSRNKSSLRETVKKMDSSSEKGVILAMEERETTAKSAPGFNRKRAEGRDESDRPKKLQLKVRTLNPANTIAYVQVYANGLFNFVYFTIDFLGGNSVCGL